MIQFVFLILLIAFAVLVLRRQYSGRLVATPYAHLLYFIFITYIGGLFLAPLYDMREGIVIALVGFATAAAAIVGYWVATSDVRNANQAVYRFTDPKMSRILAARPLHAAIVLLAIATLPIAIVFFQGLPPTITTVFDFLSGQGSFNSMIEVSDSRYQLTKSAYFGGEYRGQGLFRTLIQINSIIIASYYFARLGADRSFRNFAFVGYAIIFGWVFVGGVGDRAPFLEMLIVAISAFSLCSPIRPRLVIILMLVMMALVLITSLYSAKSMVVIRMGFSEGIADLFWRNLERLFVGNSINDARVIELVETGKWELRNGAVHFRNFLTAIPGVNYGKPVAYELFAYFNPYSKATTFFSGTYLSTTYLDFGKFGSVAIFFACGALIGIAERLIFLRKSVTGLQFVIAPLVSFSVAKIVLYGVPGLIANMVLIAVVFTVLFGFQTFYTVFTSRRTERVAIA